MYNTNKVNPMKQWMDSVTGLTSPFKPMKYEPTYEHEFVKSTKAKADTIMGVLYLNFDSYP